MSTLKVGLAAIAASAALFLIPGSAAAATTGTPVKTIKQVAVSGTSQNGKQFTGRFNIQRFVSRGGKSYAVGTLVGHVGNRHVSRSNVAIPVGVQKSTLPGTLGGAAATCPVLHLILGPLNLNLLGLHVHLNQVVLDITAVSGPGNLLGNLVCGVANLLNGGTASAGQLTGLLNILQQLLNVPALTSL
jgi:hypothetical protein